MLEDLKPQPSDKIIAMIALFKADERANKMDLGVGVYKNAQGQTPIMRAVKEAEKRLAEKQKSKSYVALVGQQSFVDAMEELSLGGSVDKSRLAGIQTPGGTGAIRQLYEMIAMANPKSKVWVSNPSWPNHIAILKYLNMPSGQYTYFDPKNCVVDFDAMLEDVAKISKGDVIILHGCCHNPTGANLTLDQWDKLSDLLLERGIIPLIDLAYQGFGDGLNEDVKGVQLVAKKLPEVLIAQSCSKNFGLYRDRVGAAIVVARDDEQAKLTQMNLNTLNRLNYSFPPDHGASVVSELYEDPKLVSDWKDELEGMRLEMLEKRQNLAAALRRETNSDRFDFIEFHRGMFSLTGLDDDQVLKLREEDAIYVVPGGRINIAGLQMTRIDEFAKSIARVISD